LFKYEYEESHSIYLDLGRNSMFGFSKEEKLCKEIGTVLHANIKQALFSNESEAGVRINDLFTSAYIFSFIENKAKLAGLDGEKFRDKNIRNIADGILPGKLYEAVVRNSAAIELLGGSDTELAREQRHLFMSGVEKGEIDSRNDNNPLLLFYHLTDSEDERKLAIEALLALATENSADEENSENDDLESSSTSTEETVKEPDTLEQRLASVKDMLEKGLITEEQADQKRRSLLEEL